MYIFKGILLWIICVLQLQFTRNFIVKKTSWLFKTLNQASFHQRVLLQATSKHCMTVNTVLVLRFLSLVMTRGDYYLLCMHACPSWPLPLQQEQREGENSQCTGSKHKQGFICTGAKWDTSRSENGLQHTLEEAQLHDNRHHPGTGTQASWSYLGQSSPSSGVISVSLCTTTLVTDMSGCCSLASLMAWARAWIMGCSARKQRQGETENRRWQGGSRAIDYKPDCQNSHLFHTSHALFSIKDIQMYLFISPKPNETNVSVGQTQQ